MTNLIKSAKRVALIVIGATIVLIGVALLVLPGPGLLVIIAGLAILGVEFAWARWLHKKATEKMKEGYTRIRDLWSRSGPSP